MYDELIKALRCMEQNMDCRECAYYGKTGCNCEKMAIDAADAIEELSATISKMEKATRWISVEERLPEYGKPVLLYFNRNNHNSMGVGDCYHDGDTLIWRGCGFIPTHWLPLPEPPKEET